MDDQSTLGVRELAVGLLLHETDQGGLAVLLPLLVLWAFLLLVHWHLLERYWYLVEHYWYLLEKYWYLLENCGIGGELLVFGGELFIGELFAYTLLDLMVSPKKVLYTRTTRTFCI